MSITQEQIDNIIRNLSKLPNKGQEWDIKKILEYMEVLNEVDTSWVEPTVSVASHVWSLREDNEIRTMKPQEVLACSKQNIIANQIALPNIMK